jgi:F-box associated protein
MTSQFLDLPVELLLLIFSFLRVHDLTTCRLLCRRLRVVIRQSALLQCRIQSLEHCIEDFSPNSSSTSDFLENLEELERASLNFGIKTRTPPRPLQRSFHKFTFFGDTNTSLFLRSGYLIQVRKGEDPGWSYMDLSLKRDLQGYTSALDWTGIHFKGREVEGWALDLSQDLVAISILP